MTGAKKKRLKRAANPSSKTRVSARTKRDAKPRTKQQETYPFEVRVHVRNHPDLTSFHSKVTILDGWDEVKAESNGQVRVDLPPGLYPIRVERGGEVFEKIHRHTGPSKELLEEPLRDSATPTFDTRAAHEYYSYTAQEWSKKNTAQASKLFKIGNDASRLFIFVRTQNEQHDKFKDLAHGLSLRQSDGSFITRFDDTVTVRDKAFGWLAFSALAQPGCYLLDHQSTRERVMPIHVFKGWDSHLFLPFDGTVQLNGASFYFAHKGQGFDPESRLTSAMDAALAGLRSGLRLLPRDLQDEALSGKFDNPMLGLIGAYSLLADANANVSLMNIVLHNLQRLLPDSSDVSALKVLAAQRLGEPTPKEPIAVPPMLRLGLEAVIRADAMTSNLVPEGSLIDQIATRLIGDSVWSQWEAPPVVSTAVTRPSPGSPLGTSLESTLEKFDFDAEVSIERDGEADKRQLERDIPGWLVNLVKDEAERRRSTVGKLDLEKLALEIGLPVRKLQQTAELIETMDSIRDAGAFPA